MKSWGYQSCMFLMGGNLNNGDQAGSAYVDLYAAPGDASWPATTGIPARWRVKSSCAVWVRKLHTE